MKLFTRIIFSTVLVLCLVFPFAGQGAVAAGNSAAAQPKSVASAMEDGSFGLDLTAKEATFKTSSSTAGGETGLLGWIKTIVNAALGVTSIVFFSLLMYAGVRWLTSRGNDDLIEKARHTIEAVIIGFALILSAWGVSNFVFKYLAPVSSSENSTGSIGGGAGCCEFTGKNGSVSCLGGRNQEACSAALGNDSNIANVTFFAQDCQQVNACKGI